jgi:O-antigen/teichoic acid export membrane protein
MQAIQKAVPLEIGPGLRLRTNFLWTLAGNVVYAGCQWGMLVVLAKTGSPEMVGQFALGLAITAPILLFANLHLRAIQATDAKQEYCFSDYLGLRLLTSLLAITVIIIFVLVTSHRESGLVVLAIGVAKVLESISDLFYGLLQQHEQMDRIAISMSVKGVLSLIALWLCVYFTHSVLWGAVGLAIAWLLVLILYDVSSGAFVLGNSDKSRFEGNKYTALLRPRYQTKTLVSLAWLALPLGLVMMLNSLGTNIPRYFIEHFRGQRDLGVYAALAYLLVAGGTIINALGASASPRLSKYYADENTKAFRSLLFRLILIAAGIGIAGVLITLVAGRELLSFLYTSEYAQNTDVFVWLMIAAMLTFISSMLGCGITAVRYFRVQLPLNIASVLAVVLGSMLLVPSYGILGAAWAICISLILLLPLKVLILGKALKKPSGMDAWMPSTTSDLVLNRATPELTKGY